MFTSQDIIVALIVGLIVGAGIGVVATSLLVVDPLLRERKLFRQRIIDEQLRAYAATARLAAHRMLAQSETDTFSKKGTDLKAVK